MQREDANNNNLEPFGTYKQLVALEELPLPEQPLKQEKRSIGLKGGASARQIYQVNYKKSQQLQLSKGNSTKMKLTKIFSNLRGQLSGQQSLEAKQTEKEQDTAVRGRNITFHTFEIFDFYVFQQFIFTHPIKSKSFYPDHLLHTYALFQCISGLDIICLPLLAIELDFELDFSKMLIQFCY